RVALGDEDRALVRGQLGGRAQGLLQGRRRAFGDVYGAAVEVGRWTVGILGTVCVHDGPDRLWRACRRGGVHPQAGDGGRVDDAGNLFDRGDDAVDDAIVEQIGIRHAILRFIADVSIVRPMNET